MKGAKRLYPWMTEDQVKNTATRLDNKLEYNLSALMKVNISYTYATVAVYCKTGVRNVGCTDTAIAIHKERHSSAKSEITRHIKADQYENNKSCLPKCTFQKTHNEVLAQYNLIDT